VYKKLVLRDRRLAGAILLGTADVGGTLRRLFKGAEPLAGQALELLSGGSARDALLEQGDGAALARPPDDTPICNWHAVSQGAIVAAIREGKCSVSVLGQCTRAGTGCGSCQPLLGQLIEAYAPGKGKAEVNKIEVMKAEKDGLDCLDDLARLMPENNWQEMTED